MKESSYKLMLLMFPEAEYVLRATAGEKKPFHGYINSGSYCTAKTVVVFFSSPAQISHMDRDPVLQNSASVTIDDPGRHDRHEVFARLRYEGAAEENIVKELGASCIDRQKGDI